VQADNKSDIDNHITALLNDILAPTNDAELRGVLRTVDVLTDFVELDNVRSILADDVLFRENRELALIAFDILRKMHDHGPDGGPAQAENVGNGIGDTVTAVIGGAIAEAPEPVESESEMFEAAPVESMPDEPVSEVMEEVIMTPDVGEVAETPAIESMSAMAEFPEPAGSEMLEATPVESLPEEAATGAPEEAIAAADAGDVAETPAIESMGAVAEDPESAESESEASEVAPVESMPGKAVTEIVGVVIGAADAGEIAEAPKPVESMPDETVSEVMAVPPGLAESESGLFEAADVESMPDETVSEVMEEAIAAPDVGEIAETPAIESMSAIAEFPELAGSEMLDAAPVESLLEEAATGVPEDALAAPDAGKIAEDPEPAESLPDEMISEAMDVPPGMAESESEMFEAADVESVPEESPPEFKLSAPEISTIIEIPEPGSEEPEPESPESTPEFPGFSEDSTNMPDMADTESPESALDFPGFSDDDSLSDDNPFPDAGTATPDMADTESLESTPDFPGFSEDDSLSDDAPFPGASPDTPDTGGGSERTWELTLDRIKELKNKYVNKL
jgi:hypothetical protein